MWPCARRESVTASRDERSRCGCKRVEESPAFDARNTAEAKHHPGAAKTIKDGAYAASR